MYRTLFSLLGKVSAIIKIFKLLRKPIRAIRFSDKYDLRFQHRGFDVELLLQVELLLEVELLLKVKLLFDLKLLLEIASLLKVEQHIRS